MQATGPGSGKNRGARISSAWLAWIVTWSVTPSSRVRSTETQPSPVPSQSSSSCAGQVERDEPAQARRAGPPAAASPASCASIRRRVASGRNPASPARMW